ncbi:MAG TPA: SufD family Fe-S cluster assembly protein [Candidatus Absconditabacterales bacterium]|nr:SufD family Fe-S cluster assembly protein [Candidatus Absconditabacterales bacterium]
MEISGSQNIVQKYVSQNNQPTIQLSSDSQFKYLAICTDNELKIDFVTKGQNIKGDIFFIFFGSTKISANIVADIRDSNCDINLNILSFLQDNSDFDINADIKIGQNIQKSQGHLSKKNIILGKDIKIKTIPRLDIHSNDVQASHGLSIDRLDPQKEFYLKSKGLDSKSSKTLMIDGHVQKILDQIDIDSSKKAEIKDFILKNFQNG